MLNQPTNWDMRAESPAEKAAICSWMYIKKVSEDQHPCFADCVLIDSVWCMAMAPPARKEWLLTVSDGKPCLSSLRALTTVFTMVLMLDAWRGRGRWEMDE
jgi:hypothetical protein